jgi:septum formation protein
VRLVLASASPRRVELLRAAGFEFEVRPAIVDESLHPLEPARDYVLRLAREKARSIRRNSGSIVLAADTTVVVDDRVLGKPASAAEARDMLKTLSGRVHEVLTGVAVVRREFELAAVEVSRVRFLPLTESEIAWYVASGEPDGKAGAYAIQGRAARFVDWIEGSYSNVVGLPLSLAYRLLKQLGWQDPPSGAGSAAGVER